MDAAEFEALVERCAPARPRGQGGYRPRGGAARPRSAAIPVGDDCAAIPDGDGHLLFAIEGFINAFVAADPWFAGWCGVMVNLSRHRRHGRPRRSRSSTPSGPTASTPPAILDGLRAAADAYGVPIVGGHTNLRNPQAQLAVAVLGPRGARLLTSFDARPGDALIAAIDHRGAYREPFDNLQAALDAPPARLRADLACCRKSPNAAWRAPPRTSARAAFPARR